MWLKSEILTRDWTSYPFVCSDSNQIIVTSIFVVELYSYRFTMPVPSVHRSMQSQQARHWWSSVGPPMNGQFSTLHFQISQLGATEGDSSMKSGMPARQSTPILYMFSVSVMYGISQLNKTLSASILLLNLVSTSCLMVLSCSCQSFIAFYIIPFNLKALARDSIGTVWPTRSAATASVKASILGS